MITAPSAANQFEYRTAYPKALAHDAVSTILLAQQKFLESEFCEGMTPFDQAEAHAALAFFQLDELRAELLRKGYPTETLNEMSNKVWHEVWERGPFDALKALGTAFPEMDWEELAEELSIPIEVPVLENFTPADKAVILAGKSRVRRWAEVLELPSILGCPLVAAVGNIAQPGQQWRTIRTWLSVSRTPVLEKPDHVNAEDLRASVLHWFDYGRIKELSALLTSAPTQRDEYTALNFPLATVTWDGLREFELIRSKLKAAYKMSNQLPMTITFGDEHGNEIAAEPLTKAAFHGIKMDGAGRNYRMTLNLPCHHPEAVQAIYTYHLDTMLQGWAVTPAKARDEKTRDSIHFMKILLMMCPFDANMTELGLAATNELLRRIGVSGSFFLANQQSMWVQSSQELAARGFDYVSLADED